MTSTLQLTSLFAMLDMQEVPQENRDAMFLDRPFLGIVSNERIKGERPLTEEYQSEFCDRHGTKRYMHPLANAASRKMGLKMGLRRGRTAQAGSRGDIVMARNGRCVETCRRYAVGMLNRIIALMIVCKTRLKRSAEFYVDRCLCG